jgi:2-keto-4-pentenoate hydratase
VETISARHSAFDINQAYLVQVAGIELRLEEGDASSGDLSGGLTAPIDLYLGIFITAEFDRIGTVQLRAA